MQIAIVFADFLWRAGVGYKIGNDAHMFEGFILGGWRGQVTPPYCYLGIHNAKDKTIRRERF